MQEELNTRLLQKISYLAKRCGVRDDSMQLLFSGGNIVFCKSECICNTNKWFEKESSSCEK